MYRCIGDAAWSLCPYLMGSGGYFPKHTGQTMKMTNSSSSNVGTEKVMSLSYSLKHFMTWSLGTFCFQLISIGLCIP
jgi:hypothetical protein